MRFVHGRFQRDCRTDPDDAPEGLPKSFVTNEARIFWQALCELFYQRDIGLVPTGQGNDDSLRARIDQGMNSGVQTSLGASYGL
jgi:hypothetical protein